MRGQCVGVRVGVRGHLHESVRGAMHPQLWLLWLQLPPLAPASLVSPCHVTRPGLAQLVAS